MAQTGSFGDIVFEASADLVRTWNGWRGQHAAKWAQHDIAAPQEKPRLEATGIDLSRLDLDVRLAAHLGVDPEEELEAMLQVLQDQEPQVLSVGGKVFGEYVLENVQEQRTHYDGRGRPLVIRVKIRLQEHA